MLQRRVLIATLVAFVAACGATDLGDPAATSCAIEAGPSRDETSNAHDGATTDITPTGDTSPATIADTNGVIADGCAPPPPVDPCLKYKFQLGNFVDYEVVDGQLGCTILAMLDEAYAMQGVLRVCGGGRWWADVSTATLVAQAYSKSHATPDAVVDGGYLQYFTAVHASPSATTSGYVALVAKDIGVPLFLADTWLDASEMHPTWQSVYGWAAETDCRPTSFVTGFAVNFPGEPTFDDGEATVVARAAWDSPIGGWFRGEMPYAPVPVVRVWNGKAYAWVVAIHLEFADGD